MKGQALADFLVDHPVDKNVQVHEEEPWRLFVDGSSRMNSAGAGIVILSPKAVKTKMAVTFSHRYTNNRAEFEALVTGLRTLKDMGVTRVQAFRDSQWVVSQISGEYRGTSPLALAINTTLRELISSFEQCDVSYVPREENQQADYLAQQASSKDPDGFDENVIHISSFKLKPLEEVMKVEVNKASVLGCKADWRQEIKEYLQNPFGKKVPANIRLAATKYFLLVNKLYRKDPQGLLLRCVSSKKILTILAEVHHGICGSHQ